MDELQQCRQTIIREMTRSSASEVHGLQWLRIGRSVEFESDRREVLIGEVVFFSDECEVAITTAAGTKRHMNVDRLWLVE